MEIHKSMDNCSSFLRGLVHIESTPGWVHIYIYIDSPKYVVVASVLVAFEG